MRRPATVPDLTCGIERPRRGGERVSRSLSQCIPFGKPVLQPREKARMPHLLCSVEAGFKEGESFGDPTCLGVRGPDRGTQEWFQERYRSRAGEVETPF